MSRRVYTLPNDISREISDFDGALDRLTVKLLISLQAQGDMKLFEELGGAYARWLKCSDGIMGLELVTKIRDILGGRGIEKTKSLETAEGAQP